MKYNFLDLARANEPYMEQLQEAACKVIKSGRYLHGEQTNLLEQEIAGLCEAKYCIAVSNGLPLDEAMDTQGTLRRVAQVVTRLVTDHDIS